jgi:ribosome-binding ATPase YchF (GTP1/OBG family)
MLPYKQEKGLLAFKRIMCFTGIPDELKGKTFGTIEEAKSKGKVRMEGKDYVMQDGDVVEFRFNV